ncbi:MAG: DUF5686 and carboxypeptidase regulatory-like domain-containing protein [Saprospiraceae bacterium]|nr:DUF5686 and carboxypeptidase regulatory-like domain-containing protein [Saprospiraceae bacterium]
MLPYHLSPIMHQKTLFCFLLLFSIYFVSDLQAQNTSKASSLDTTIIRGTIKDARSKEVLPFVDIYLVGTPIGSSSDIDGNFEIVHMGSLDSLEFAYIGYKTQYKKVKQGKEQTLNISLRPEEKMLVTATVTAKQKRRRVRDTAAIALWRNIVKYKTQNSLNSADSYRYEDYTKIQFNFDRLGQGFINNKFLNKRLGIAMDHIQINDLGENYLPILMKETISTFYYRKNPKSQKTVVTADQFSGFENESVSAFVSEQVEELDPFDNVVVVAGKSFIGPFGSGANIAYRYTLSDTLEIDGDKYYQLDFSGKRRQDLTFVGSAIVHAKTFGVAKIDMDISKYVNINFLKGFGTSQKYRLIDGYWVLIEGKNIARIKVPERPSFLYMSIERSTSRRDFDLNIPLSDSIFDGDNVSREKKAYKRDNSYWKTMRHDSITTQESNIYTMVDSVQNTGLYKALDFTMYALTSGYLRTGPIEFGSVSELLSKNAIEGWRLKLKFRTNNRFSEYAQIMAYTAYGFQDKEFKYGLGLNFKIPTKKDRWQSTSLLYKYDLVMLGQVNRFMAHDNISNSLSRRDPLGKLMKIREFNWMYTRDWFKGFYNTLTYRWRTFYQVPNVFEFTSGENLDPIEQFTTSEFILKTHYGIKESFYNNGFNRSTLGSKLPIFELDYTLGVKGFLGGEYNYHKLDLSIKQRLSLPFGYTRYELRGGKVWGNIPYPLLRIHLGNEGLFRNRFAYNMMNEFEFVSDEYAAFWMEHHFDGVILNSIPLIKLLRWRTVFIFKGLMGRVSDANRLVINIPENISSPNYYAEIGFGIENIFDIFRVDFMWRLTQRNVVGTRRFAIRLSFAPGF